DSANRRLFQAEGFLATEEIVRRATRIVAEMVIDEQAIARNMAIYGPFAATERVLMALVAAGASRQDGHEWIREASLQAWAVLRDGRSNPLVELLLADGRIGQFLASEKISELMKAEGHVGTAVTRARAFAQTVREALGDG
ncbi:MAG: adenylosuccinate lyase, partial [Anaerolineales bacterium]|nr:adenylosuccinate lyase [Anaerolineales bacterium]